MKKLIILLFLSASFIACNNDNTSNKGDNPADTSVTSPSNEMANPNNIPGSNEPAQGMGSGDTSSYERAPSSTATDTTRTR